MMSVAVTANAGEIQLSNGDRLQGQLVKLEDDYLYWRSANFGELKVATAKIQTLSLDKPVKIDGRKVPCAINGVSDGQLQYRCEDGESVSVALLSVESMQPFVDFSNGSYSYAGKLSVAGSHSRGNKDEEDWDINSQVKLRKGDFRHVFSLKYESESIEDAGTNEEHDADYRLDWFFSESWFWYNKLGFSADDSRNLNEGYDIGTGLGHQVWESLRSGLAYEAGLQYTQERYSPTDEEALDPDFESNRDEALFRVAFDFSYRFPRSIELIHNHEFLYSLEESENWRFNSETGFNIPLMRGIYSEFIIEYDYDNGAQGDTDKDDTKLRVGVGYQW